MIVKIMQFNSSNCRKVDKWAQTVDESTVYILKNETKSSNWPA